jgi:ubiquinone/menaquinone biosynthesis C-methylase UbiE
MISLPDDRRLGGEKQNCWQICGAKYCTWPQALATISNSFHAEWTSFSIDISAKMLERAKVTAKGYQGSIELREAGVHSLDYLDSTFDSVVTVFAFCSVPKPIVGLQEQPGGQILMLEHVRSSAIAPVGIMMDLDHATHAANWTGAQSRHCR